jgi:chitinase
MSASVIHKLLLVWHRWVKSRQDHHQQQHSGLMLLTESRSREGTTITVFAAACQHP